MNVVVFLDDSGLELNRGMQINLHVFLVQNVQTGQSYIVYTD